MNAFGLKVDGANAILELEPNAPTPYCPGWSERRGALTARASYQAFTHPSGLQLVDVFNCAHDGKALIVQSDDIGFGFTIYPGAGRAFILGVSPDLVGKDVGAPPVAFDTLESGFKLPDLMQVGETGSPRNQIVPSFHKVLAVTPAEDFKPWLHAYRFSGFQVGRRYQRADVDALFKLYAFTENDPESGVPSAKTWMRESAKVQSAVYGLGVATLDAWKATHFDGGELAAIYRRGRDPRSYDQAKRLIRSFLTWDWYVGSKSHAKKMFDENTRIKARCLEGIARGRSMAAISEDSKWRDELAVHGARTLGAIAAQWPSTQPFPSKSAPDKRHLATVEWDNTWMIGLLGWAAALYYHVTGDVDALSLAERCADTLEAWLWDKKTDTFWQDIPADGAKEPRTKYVTKDGKPDFGGTLRWCVPVFYGLGRADAPVCARIVDGAAAIGKPIEDPTSAASGW